MKLIPYCLRSKRAKLGERGDLEEGLLEGLEGLE